MLNSLTNTLEELLLQLAKPNPILITVPAMGSAPSEVITIPVYHARASKLTNAQNHDEEYPQCSIFDYFPEHDLDWNPNWKSYLDDFHDFDADGKPRKAFEYEEPLRYLFRFDMTFFMSNYIHRIQVADYMNQRFGKMGGFTLNSHALVVNAEGDTEKVGDRIGYTMVITENTRQDGIFELNYEVTSKAMVAGVPGKEVDLIQTLNTNLIVAPKP